ncbi:MAG: tol-pal system-associated acyl-CoA thioesterase [Gammaproteobacteria bacterium]|jgi:tol-pal system-associated acyl-CoA thioesterase
MREFNWPIRVYIEDTDAGGIVYYVNYLKYMERARTEFFRSFGDAKDEVFGGKLMFVVQSLNSQYLKPAKLDDTLIATVRVITYGKASVVMEQNVYRLIHDPLQAPFNEKQASRELLCRGEVKIACVDRQTIKPKRMPAEILTKLSGIEASNKK